MVFLVSPCYFRWVIPVDLRLVEPPTPPRKLAGYHCPSGLCHVDYYNEARLDHNTKVTLPMTSHMSYHLESPSE
jgi:hypothetical protein